MSMPPLQEGRLRLVPMVRVRHTVHVHHLGGVSEHDGSLGVGGQAGGLGAANAVVRGICRGGAR